VNLQIEDVRGLIINLETGNICGLWNLSQPFQAIFCESAFHISRFIPSRLGVGNLFMLEGRINLAVIK
jgi:hypothetical protein